MKSIKKAILSKHIENKTENKNEKLPFYSKLDLAVENKDYEEAKRLITSEERNPFIISSDDDFSPFHRAALNNNPQIIKLFLTSKFYEKNNNINQNTITDKYTALHLVMKYGCYDVLLILLDQPDINLEPRSSLWEKPLNLAKQEYIKIKNDETAKNKSQDIYRCIETLEKKLNNKANFKNDEASLPFLLNYKKGENPNYSECIKELEKKAPTLVGNNPSTMFNRNRANCLCESQIPNFEPTKALLQRNQNNNKWLIGKKIEQPNFPLSENNTQQQDTSRFLVPNYK